ncbi:hypothetical protein N0V88_002404 [Collariella sp. IMI 366227]|nr:hypothetical protein N0V88_002404 [Collariella sp. IMI 366227]
MAGRPRRRRASSSSAAAAADDSHIRWSKETSVLRPVSEEDIDDSDWPCYILTDATVYKKDGKTMANPLLVQFEGPLIVRGLLEVQDYQLSNLVKPSLRSAYIEIQYSTQYSVGDGPIALWVSGAAGWYELQPSVKYQPMYDQILEAMTLYYSALEVYAGHAEEHARKKKGSRPPQPDLDEVFFSYAVRTGDGILRHEVESLCHKWANFLIPHFPKENELDWNTTRFAKWLRGEHPDILKKVSDAQKGIIAPPPPPQLQSPEIELPHRRRSRSARASNWAPEADDPIPNSDLDLNSPVDRLLAGLRLVTTEAKVQPTTVKAIHSRIYFKCKMRTYNSVVDVITYFAQGLLPRLGPEWKGTEWYKWLQGVASQEPEPVDAATVELYSSQTQLRALGSRQGQTRQRSAAQVPPNIGLKAKSKKSAQHESEAESDEDIAAYAAPPMRSQRAGKGATLRLISTASKKRPLSDLDDQASGSRRGGKSAKFSHPVSDEDDPFEDAEDTSDDEVAEEEEMTVGSRLPLPDGAVRVMVYAEPIPTTSPSGPDGTWTCSEDCTYVVRCADEQESQELIQQHFRDHEAQTEKVNLALTESRGHMPIKYA